MFAFPKELNFSSSKPLAENAKPAILRYRSDSTNYSAGDTIRIEIPTGRAGQILFPKDSFLEGKVTLGGITAGNVASTFVIDNSVYALFNRLRITHGSNVGEDCLHTNRLWTALYDLQINSAERLGDSITKLVNEADVLNGVVCSTVPAAGGGAQVNNPMDFTFTIPSALLGSLAQKAIPLGQMSSSSLYLELELAPFTHSFIRTGNATGGTYSVSDIYYNAKVSTLDGDINRLLLNTTAGVINLPAVSYKVEPKTIAAGSAMFNDKFTFQFTSMKNFIFWVHNSGSMNDVTRRSISSRTKANINRYYLSINGEAYPTQPIETPSSMYSNLLRAYDSLTDTNAGGIINRTNYSADATNVSTIDTDGIASNKRFMAGIDTDKYNQSSDILLSGTTTTGQLISLNIEMSAATTEGLTLLGACMFDVVYHVEGGQLVQRC
jgi:hypothetical protein